MNLTSVMFSVKRLNDSLNVNLTTKVCKFDLYAWMILQAKYTHINAVGTDFTRFIGKIENKLQTCSKFVLSCFSLPNNGCLFNVMLLRRFFGQSIRYGSSNLWCKRVSLLNFEQVQKKMNDGFSGKKIDFSDIFLARNPLVMPERKQRLLIIVEIGKILSSSYRKKNHCENSLEAENLPYCWLCILSTEQKKATNC